MRSCLFIHNFYQDGRADVLAEVRVLQASGQWTSGVRARMRKKATTDRERLKHTSASPPQARAYYAGRITALKSRLTADFSPEQDREPVHDIIYRPLPPDASRFCGSFDCCETAVWALSLWGDKHASGYLCDRCRQEWQRQATSTTADGWDWTTDEESMEDLGQVDARPRSLQVVQSGFGLVLDMLLLSCFSLLLLPLRLGIVCYDGLVLLIADAVLCLITRRSLKPERKPVQGVQFPGSGL